MKLLFICTHNRCRSILAEAITNFYGKGFLIARSAGSQPAGMVHPLSIKYLNAQCIPTEGLCSQSWDEHENWQPDVVVTVCDSAAGEACPVWFGNSIRVHWGLVDPSSIKGSDEDIEHAFNETIEILRYRIEKLISLNIQNLSSKECAEVCNSLGVA